MRKKKQYLITIRSIINKNSYIYITFDISSDSLSIGYCLVFARKKKKKKNGKKNVKNKYEEIIIIFSIGKQKTKQKKTKPFSL